MPKALIVPKFRPKMADTNLTVPGKTEMLPQRWQRVPLCKWMM